MLILANRCVNEIFRDPGQGFAGEDYDARKDFLTLRHKHAKRCRASRSFLCVLAPLREESFFRVRDPGKFNCLNAELKIINLSFAHG